MNGSAPLVAVVMGVSGCGKTTLAQALARSWPASFIDADDLHDAAARALMARGQPLTDALRDPWIARIVAALHRHVDAGERVALACSALRHAHRDRLRASGLPMRFLFLHGDRELVAARIRAREGHYMPVSLLDSQYAALEDPRGEPGVHALAIDEAPAQLLDQALAALA